MFSQKPRIFTSEELCAIIKACGDSRVDKFTYESLCISFTNQVEEVPDEAPPIMGGGFTQSSPTREVTLEDELAIKRERLANMVIEDPAEYERLVSLGDLSEEKAGD